MAQKNNGKSSKKIASVFKKPISKKSPAQPVRGEIRNSPLPRSAAAKPKVITQEMIAIRAYEISQSPQCGSETDNWHRAERELRGA